jgi:hypothetical protein
MARKASWWICYEGGLEYVCIEDIIDFAIFCEAERSVGVAAARVCDGVAIDAEVVIERRNRINSCIVVTDI